MRIKLPFQFKIYFLIILLFGLLISLTTYRVNHIVTDRIMEEEITQFKELKTLFYNLLASRIETIREEALLQADRPYVQESLTMLKEGRLVESFLVSSFANVERRELLIVTDSNGVVVDGLVRMKTPQQEVQEIQTTSFIQQIVDSLTSMEKVKQGRMNVEYVLLRDQYPFSLFVVAIAPVFNPSRDEVLGSVCVGFPVDEKFARDLKSGSQYQLGFTLQNRLIATTLHLDQAIDFRNHWDPIPKEQKTALLDEPEMMTLFNEPYLLYASPMPMSERDNEFYVIFSPLKNLNTFLSKLKSTIYTVGLAILCVVLLIAYFIAKSITAPVKQLVQTVSRITNGEYLVDASIHTGDEFETLGQEINAMSNTLHQRENKINDYVAEIENLNRDLELKVAERTQDLEEKNFRLRMISEELGRAYAQIDEELKTVGELQKNLMPKPSLDMNGIAIRAMYLPNGRTGGDYYDFFPFNNNQIFLLIADVSGHGFPAAFIMGITRSITHTLVAQKSSPGKVLSALSTTLMSCIRSGEFVTMFMGKLDLESKVLTYSSAGHPPPLYYSTQRNELTELELNRGLPLGILEKNHYEEVCIKFDPGDRLLMYTDGIIEANNDKRDAFGLERLKEIMMQYKEAPPTDFLDMITVELENHLQRPLNVEPSEDDVTLVAMDFKEVESTKKEIQHHPQTAQLP